MNRKQFLPWLLIVLALIVLMPANVILLRDCMTQDQGKLKSECAAILDAVAEPDEHSQKLRNEGLRMLERSKLYSLNHYIFQKATATIGDMDPSVTDPEFRDQGGTFFMLFPRSKPNAFDVGFYLMNCEHGETSHVICYERYPVYDCEYLDMKLPDRNVFYSENGGWFYDYNGDMIFDFGFRNREPLFQLNGQWIKADVYEYSEAFKSYYVEKDGKKYVFDKAAGKWLEKQ